MESRNPILSNSDTFNGRSAQGYGQTVYPAGGQGYRGYGQTSAPPPTEPSTWQAPPGARTGADPPGVMDRRSTRRADRVTEATARRPRHRPVTPRLGRSQPAP